MRDLVMAEASETEHADEAVRARRFDHRTSFLDYCFGAADERGSPFVEPLHGQTSREIREAFGEFWQIVGGNRIAAPNIVRSELPEAGDLRRGFSQCLLVVLRYVNV